MGEPKIWHVVVHTGFRTRRVQRRSEVEAVAEAKVLAAVYDRPARVRRVWDPVGVYRAEVLPTGQVLTS